MEPMVGKIIHDFQGFLSQFQHVQDKFSLIVSEAITKYNSGTYNVMYEHFAVGGLVDSIKTHQHNLFEEIHKKNKSETQKTSAMCERYVLECVKNAGFIQSTLPKQHMKMFRSIVHNEVFKADDVCGQMGQYFPEQKLYVVHQPFGSQNTPDILLVQVVGDIVHTMPIEVKQGHSSPTWNNNPPKANFGYVFVCTKDQTVYFAPGKAIRGEAIVTDEIVKFIHSEMCKLVTKTMYAPESNTNVISYKKIEFNGFPKT